ncbi:MAG TPA: hypothetical protein VIH18_19390 [Candidatus Binatia bacterium]
MIALFGFGDQIWGFAIELGEHPNRAGVGFLGRFSFPIELRSSDHPLIPIIHKSSPSKKKLGELLSNNDVKVEQKNVPAGLTAAQRLT